MSRLNRLTKEKDDLDINIEKLRAFIWDGDERFEELPMVDVSLLIEQLHVMRQYSVILNTRKGRC